MLPVLRTNLPLSPFAGTAFNRLDSLFDRFFGEELEVNRPAWGWGFVPVSMWQDDNNIYVDADLPGVTDKDLEITVHNRVLTIKAERRDEESRKYTFNGRTFGVLERAVVLPELGRFRPCGGEAGERNSVADSAQAPRCAAEEDRGQDGLTDRAARVTPLRSRTPWQSRPGARAPGTSFE